MLHGERRRQLQLVGQPQHDASLGIGLDIAEAQCLRQEITTRITLMNALIALELATIGTGLTAINEASFLLVGLGAASSFLWLLWMDQSLYTYKIAAYLSVELAPRLSALAERPVLGWETFVRHIEANGEISDRVLYPRSTDSRRKLRFCGRHAEWYVPLLFAVTPLLLLARYIINSNSDIASVVAAILTTGSVWIYTALRFALLTHDINILNNAIIAAGARPDSGNPVNGCR